MEAESDYKYLFCYWARNHCSLTSSGRPLSSVPRWGPTYVLFTRPTYVLMVYIPHTDQWYQYRMARRLAGCAKSCSLMHAVTRSCQLIHYTHPNVSSATSLTRQHVWTPYHAAMDNHYWSRVRLDKNTWKWSLSDLTDN